MRAEQSDSHLHSTLDDIFGLMRNAGNVKDLIEIEKFVGQALVENYKHYSATKILNHVRNHIANTIDEAIKSTFKNMPEIGENLIKQRAALKAEYRNFAFQKSRVGFDEMSQSFRQHQNLDNFVHAAQANVTHDDVAKGFAQEPKKRTSYAIGEKEMSESELEGFFQTLGKGRENVELIVLNGIVQRAEKKIGKDFVVDNMSIYNDLKSINPDLFKSDKGKQAYQILDELTTQFKHDTEILRFAARDIASEEFKYWGMQPLIFKVASKVFNSLRARFSEEAGYRYCLQKALERKRNFKEIGEILGEQSKNPSLTPQDKHALLETSKLMIKVWEEREKEIAKKEAAEKKARELQRKEKLKREKENVLKTSGDDVGEDILPTEDLGTRIENAETMVFSDKDKGYPASYQIVDSNKLFTSFKYGENYQFREIDQPKVVINIRENFDPKLIFTREGGFEGLPVVDNKGRAIIGNHRLEAMLQFNEPTWEKYAKEVFLKYGAKLERGQFLVRVLDPSVSLHERIALAKASNTSRVHTDSERSLVIAGKYADSIHALIHSTSPVQPTFKDAANVNEMRALVAAAMNDPLEKEATNHALLLALCPDFIARKRLLQREMPDVAEIIQQMLNDNAGALLLNAISPNAKNIDISKYLAGSLHLIAEARKFDKQKRDRFIQSNVESLNIDFKNIYDLEKVNGVSAFEQFKADLIALALARFSKRENPSGNLYAFLKEIGEKQEHSNENLFGEEYATTLWDNLLRINRIDLENGEDAIALDIKKILTREKEYLAYKEQRELTEQQLEQLAFRNELLSTEDGRNALQFAMQTKMYGTQSEQNIAKEILAKQGYYLNYDGALSIIEGKAKPENPIETLSKNAEMFFGTDTSFMQQMKEGFTGDINKKWWIVPRGKHSVVEYAKEIDPSLVSFERADVGSWYADVQGIVHKVALKKQDTLMIEHYASNEIPPAKTWLFHNENQITRLMQAYNGDVLLIDTLNKDNTRTILAKNKDTITKTSIDANGNATTTNEEAGKNVELFSKFLQESEGIETAGKKEADVVAKNTEAESQRLQEIAEDFKGRFPNLSSQEMLEGISNTIATRFPNLDSKSAIDAWLLSRDILEDSQHFGEKKGAIKLTSERHKLEKLLKIEPITEFGTNYAEFYHSGTSAIQKVMQEKQGQVAGAFYRKELGDITIAWGDSNFGLQHILERRTADFGEQKALDIVNEIPNIIEHGKIYRNFDNKIELITDKYTLVLGLRDDKKFIVTALRDSRNKKRLETTQTGVAGSLTGETLEKNPLSPSQTIPDSTPPNIKNTLENGDVQHDNPPPTPSAREGENVGAESSAHHISATEVAPPKNADTSVGERAAANQEPQTTNDVDLQSPSSFFVSQDFGEALALRSGKQRLADNLEALRTLGELAEGAALNAERQQSLASYSGFGGLMVKDVEGMRQLLLPIAENDAFVQHALLGKGIYDAHHRADILYSQIAANADNSYYTPHSVISAIWEHLGFVRGRVLEPSMGIGNFFTSMPAALSHRTQKVGIEIDPIAAAIGKQLSPDVDVQAKSFYDYKGDVGFDLVIGNPPYGEHLKDFILKSVDSAKENGIIVQVVSNAFLDNAASRDVRTAIADKAELLGAVRLPSKTFSGTDIATDIVVFQKRSGKQNSTYWRGAKTYKEDSELTLNNYYHENPEHILGELVVGSTQYGQRWIVKQGEDIEDALHEKLGAILAKRENESDCIIARQNDVQEAVASGFTPHTFFVLNDTIMQAQKNAEPIPVDFLQSVRGNGAPFETLNKSAQTRRTNEAKKAESMARDYLTLRDSLLAMRSSEALDSTSEESLQSLRQTLNDSYDSFVQKFGKVSENTLLKKVFAEDPSFSSVADLDARGRHQILDSRVIFPYQIPTKAKDIQDAIAISKGYAGKISEDYINELLGDRYAVQKALESGELFADAKGNLFTKDAFVVGDLGARIDAFKELKELNPQQKKALETLEAALPEPLEIHEIYYHPSSNFIPKEAMLGFFDSLGVKATYYKPTNSFIIDHKSGSHTFQTAYSAITKNMEHSATAVLESLLKNKPLRFSKQVGGVKQSYPEQFAANKMAQDKLLETFYSYMQKHYAKDIADSYNHKFRRIVANDFQDEPILYGANPDIKLHPHQKSAIAFATSLQNVLLDHSVGAGKTYEMIAIASEWKRLGISKNPLFVVPNHLVEQWAKSFTQLYPASRVLSIPTNENERKRTLAMLANGGNDFDAVIMPHSTFDSIHLSREKSAQYVYEEIQELEQFEKELRQQASKNKDEFTKKEQERLEKSIAKKKIALQQKYDKLLDTKAAKEDSIAFEELGFDSLFVDEAHAYKNLGFLSANRNIRGMSNAVGSQKALNLLHKVKNMQEREQRIVFATGTPLVNSVSEVYTWQRFLAPQFLKDNKIASFDSWVNLFGQVSSELERTPVGTYKDIMRLRSFKNTSELSALYRQFAHYVDVSQTHIKRPSVEQVSIQCQSSPQQKDYMQHLLKRYEALSEGELMEGFENDNYLNITTDGINAALDYRIIDKAAEDFSESKINRATSEMLKLYKESNKDLGTQLVFIDRSTPKPKRGIRDEIRNVFEEYYHAKDEKTEEALAQKLEEMAKKHHYDNIDEMRNAVYGDFSVYEDMRDKLIKQGIPQR